MKLRYLMAAAMAGLSVLSGGCGTTPAASAPPASSAAEQKADSRSGEITNFTRYADYTPQKRYRRTWSPV